VIFIAGVLAMPPELTLAEAASQLGVHTKTVRRLIAAGRLPAYRVGPRLIRLKSEDVAAVARPLATAATR
jgi:excisionase family DNA binding protein